MYSENVSKITVFLHFSDFKTFYLYLCLSWEGRLHKYFDRGFVIIDIKTSKGVRVIVMHSNFVQFRGTVILLTNNYFT